MSVAMKPTMPSAKLAVLLSGGGRTMVNLQGAIERGELHARIVRVIASKTCAGVDRARELGIEAQIIEGEIPAARLDELLADAEWVVLAGYLKKVHVPERYRGRVVNIHPSLLPSFGGKGMYGHRVHEAVLSHGCKVSGCTVHLVDDQFDTGRIIAQRACPVLPDDTADTLAARVFEQECLVYPQAIADLIAGRVR